MSRGVLRGRSARIARRGSTFLEIVGNCDRIANITLFCANNVKLMTMSLVCVCGGGGTGVIKILELEETAKTSSQS